ncbi:hypothetical protein CDD80_7238 [Ophiocordyceps camponoti-rufipedis]|uniref:N-acetyltransferase domain-containing protein n=1 Tax=Ophiocordyceps camponoti-rufipedis TaxID=2004952 RepID=A0A2C5YH12_9HYPO|nr:hypothetical protein CDD80_7238 [Ophiocordyceps camponoti-rufipedis]
MAQVPYQQPSYTNGDLLNTTISTTLPKYLPHPLTPTFDTTHLVIRQLKETDEDAFLDLFAIPGALGDYITNPYENDLTPPERFDASLPDEYNHLFFNPYVFGVFIKTPDNREGELIGFGGEASGSSFRDHVPPYYLSHWPNLLLKFKREYWLDSASYVTEFITVLMDFWWQRVRIEAVGRNPRSMARDLPFIPRTNNYPEIFGATCLPEASRVLQEVGFDFVRRLDNGQEVWCDWYRDRD